MNTQKSSKKNLFIAIAIIVVAGIAYFYYKGNSSSSSSSTLSVQGPDTTAVGSQVLTLLNQIRSLQIDSKFFTDPGYQTLRDYSVQIPPVSVGRTNPFAPLPGEQTTAPSTGTGTNQPPASR